MEISDLERLREQFGTPSRVTFDSGVNGFPKVELRHPEGGVVEIYLHGATVTSWKHPQFGEILYRSPKAVFAEGKAIRGGAPVVFPQFSGEGPLPAHGIARARTWKVRSAEAPVGDAASIVFALSDSDETRAIWEHSFELLLSVELSSYLAMSLSVKNTGTQPYSYQCALHTYFGIGDISQVTVGDLSGLEYRDNTNGERAQESRSELTVDSEVDRVYMAAPEQVCITDKASNRKILVNLQGMRDAVVWNPWIEKAGNLPDLGAEEYRKFICVEVGNISEKVTIAPGSRKSAGQTLEVAAL